MSKGVKKTVEKKQKRNLFSGKSKGFFSCLVFEFFPLQKERILVIPGGYRGEAGQQWREHP